MPFPILPVRRFTEWMMTETCDVERFTSTRDEYGDETQTWTVVHAGVPCTHEALSGDESVIAERLSADVNTRIFLPFGTDVNTDDRIVITVGDLRRRYSIDYIPDNAPGLSGSVEAFCRFVEYAT
jgi:SPP1 family predicted phage head-tail adaptor